MGRKDMLKITLVASALITSGGAHAQKSANQCAREVGNVTGQSREQRMMDCLLAHVPKPPVEPKGTYFIRRASFEIDPAGGVKPEFTIVNPQRGRTIKYVYVSFALFNRVGDEIKSRDGGPLLPVRFTGPLRYEDDPYPGGWGPRAYGSAACLRIDMVLVEYMESPPDTFTGDSLRQALHPSIKNDCRVAKR